MTEAELVTSYYKNSTMACEAIGCHSCVARVYQPFCTGCFHRAILKGHFLSRDGTIYEYNGRRWVNRSPVVRSTV